jgi:REP element-mobilizing transposase RayT
LNRKLPHFDGEVTQFITFRLADSLPQPVLKRLTLEIENGKLNSDSDEYRQIVEEYLDRGAGECILKDRNVAKIVMSTFLYEDGRSCDLKAWVIMPNHAHILVRLRSGYDLAGLMKRIKGVSARKINQYLGRSGSVWQQDYFDRYIRDAQHFSDVFQYIENNPVVAGLAARPEDWEFGSAHSRAASAPDNIDADSSQISLAASGDADKSVRAPFGAPYERHDLSSLRAFGSTGEPWNPGDRLVHGGVVGRAPHDAGRPVSGTGQTHGR